MVLAVWLHKINYEKLHAGSRFSQASNKDTKEFLDKTKGNDIYNHKGEKLKFIQKPNVPGKQDNLEVSKEKDDSTDHKEGKESELTDEDETQQDFDVTQDEDSNITAEEADDKGDEDSNVTQEEADDKGDEDSNVTQGGADNKGDEDSNVTQEGADDKGDEDSNVAPEEADDKDEDSNVTQEKSDVKGEQQNKDSSLTKDEKPKEASDLSKDEAVEQTKKETETADKERDDKEKLKKQKARDKELQNSGEGIHDEKLCKVVYDPGLNKSFWSTSNPHKYKYIINNKHRCSGANISVMFMIISAPENEKLRQLARDTWTSVSSYMGLTISHVFLVGYRREGLNEQIRKENNKYHDIVQEDFMDSYQNLTIKSIMGLKWTTTYCKNAELIFKIDDDTLINIFLLLKHLKEKEFLKTESILCYSSYLTPDELMPVRDLGFNKTRINKWILTRDEYPENCFPTYCAGSGYAMNQQIASKLYQVALKTRMLTIEDVYITGILPALSGVRYRKQWLANFTFYRDFTSPNTFQILDHMFVVHVPSNIKQPQLENISRTWKNVMKKRNKTE